MLAIAGCTGSRRYLKAAERLEKQGLVNEAADYYLEAGLTDDAKTPDTLTLDARLHAASALEHAGLQDDARAQFEWLRKNDKDRQRLEATEHQLQPF